MGCNSDEDRPSHICPKTQSCSFIVGFGLACNLGPVKLEIMDGTAHKVPSNVADHNIVRFARELFLMVINNHFLHGSQC